MDIGKEREAFEKEFKIKWEIGHFILKMVKFIEESQDYAPVNAVKQMSDEYYWVLALNTGWWAWQARAKAQAVPEQDQRIWATSNLTWKEVAFRALSCKVLKTTQNWVHVKNIASVGSTTASLICEKLGVNPDGTKFNLIKPQEQGHA